MTDSGKSVRNVLLLAALALAACSSEPTQYDNPYSPAHGHPYRVGYVATRECSEGVKSERSDRLPRSRSSGGWPTECSFSGSEIL